MGSYVMPSRAVLELDASHPTLAVDDLAEPELAPVPGPGADGRESLVWAEFAEVAGGSTAWANLVLALNSADEEIGYLEDLSATGDMRSVSAYWDWAWNAYSHLMAQVGDPDSETRRLAVAYNLDELAECGWCQTPDVDGNMRQFEKQDGSMAPYHTGCLAEMLREQGL